jgi:hypothetical protein
MPPTTAHLNGSVNLPDAETVMREVLTRIPTGLRRVPDGEPGDRANWILFQFQKFMEMDGLELERSEADPETYTTPKLTLTGSTLVWPDLGYANAYRESHATFETLARPRVRFQVQYPTPLASIVGFIAEQDRSALLPSYQQALFADLEQLLATVPHDRVAVQWDVAVEFGLLEGAMGPGAAMPLDQVTPALVRAIELVPADVPVGMHLCYGDYGHQHFKQPQSLEMQVDLVNAVVAGAGRPVNWASFTVPQGRGDADYFAPLRGLRAGPETELYFALVPYHPSEQAEGTSAAQAEHIDAALAESAAGPREWGVCTECGMGRVASEDVPALLDIHSELLKV